MERPRTVPVDASIVTCAFCRKTLKPPTFKCDAGHVVCEDCIDGHLRLCTGGPCIPCRDMDRVVRALPKVPCVHKDGGCTAQVAYIDSADHLRSCPFVPCQCPSEYCTFTASPAALLQHLSEKHRRPVVRNYVYGQPWKFTISRFHSDGAALAAESDGCVFVVHASELKEATAVSVVCLRASEDASEVARQFRCQLWVEGGATKAPVFSFRVPSSDGSLLPGKQGLFLAVPHLELPFSFALVVRIDKGGGGAAGSSDDEDGGSGDEAGRTGGGEAACSSDEGGVSGDEASSTDEDQ